MYTRVYEFLQRYNVSLMIVYFIKERLWNSNFIISISARTVTNFIHMAWISQLIWSFLPTKELGKKMKMCILTSPAGHCAAYAQHPPPAVWAGMWAATDTPGFGEAGLECPMGRQPRLGRSPSQIRMLGGCPKRRCQDGQSVFHGWAKEGALSSYKIHQEWRQDCSYIPTKFG